MKRLVLTSFAVALLAALVATASLAKGASEAEVTGPGLSTPITLGGSGEPGSGAQLGSIADAAGFFAALFGQSPDPMLAERPAGDLGPRYTVAYVMPGGNGENDRIVQDVYPYAQPNPVTYMAPGQPFYDTYETRGGWFVATSVLKDYLVEAGLPRNAPVVGDGDGFPWALASGLTALAAALAVGALGAYVIRRRPETATTA